MAYTPRIRPVFDPRANFTYTVDVSVGREIISYTGDKDTTIDEFKALFEELRENELKDARHDFLEIVRIYKTQFGNDFSLNLKQDRGLMVAIKEFNESVVPVQYTLIAFDRDTCKGNYSEGQRDTLDEIKWLIEEINAREGENAPIFEVGIFKKGYCGCYNFLDDIDREIVKGWGLLGK